MFNKISRFLKERCKLKIKHVHGFKPVEFDAHFLEHNVVCVYIALPFPHGCVYYVRDTQVTKSNSTFSDGSEKDLNTL